MIARRKMSQIEGKTTEIGGFKKLGQRLTLSPPRFDDESAVDGARRVGEVGAQLVDTLASLNQDERVMHFAKMATQN